MLAALISLTMLLAACGKSESSSKATTTTASTTTTTTIPPAAADKAKAQTILLTQADVGAGYKPSDDEEDSGDDSSDDSDKAFEECSQGNAFLNSDDESRAASSEFSKDEFTSVGSDAEFATSEADAKAALDILSGDAILKCMADAFKTALKEEIDEPGVTLADAQAFRKPVPAGVKAEQSTALEIALVVKGGGLSIPVFIDMVILRKGRAVASLFTTHGQTPFPQSEEARLAGILSTHLAAA